MTDAVRYWDALEKAGKKISSGQLTQVMRDLCRCDRFYLLVRVCGRKDMLHQWIYRRCREVEAEPDGYLDLWSREHYKTSIITFGGTLQAILKDPDVTVGIFSHTRPIAKAFMRQIMRELESNETLHALFPDILWGKDVKQSPKWSEDDGIIVKRKSNPNEATIEAWGVVDGQPTSKHFRVLMYDDIVTADSVTNPEMIEKTMKALELSYNLGSFGGVQRFAGTHYHFNDPYFTLIKRGAVKVRRYPATDDGTEDGNPVFWDRETLAQKRRIMGPYTFGTQILLNPKADALQGFKREWLRYFTLGKWETMNVYICVDSANSKRKESDYTAMWVIGLAEDNNFYVLDMVRDRLNLVERCDRLYTLAKKFSRRLVEIRYERYGMMADIEHIKSEGDRRGYRIEGKIKECAGRAGKDDRIRRLLSAFESGRIYLPHSLHVTDWEKNTRDLVHDFVEEEYYPFPVSNHKDMLDSLSRIMEPDLPLQWPIEVQPGWNKRLEYPEMGIV
jgi:predicted phage terminase large subunit-like protein